MEKEKVSGVGTDCRPALLEMQHGRAAVRPSVPIRNAMKIVSIVAKCFGYNW